MFDPITQAAIDQEIFCAENARLTGNEGKARVCARRAAGVAIRAYYKAAGMSYSDPSAYSILMRLSQLKSTPENINKAVSRLLTRVAADYTLPIQADLIEDAKMVIDWAAMRIKEGNFD